MDGSVAVYNVILPSSAPQYKSNDVNQKHAGIVWQVMILMENKFSRLNFIIKNIIF